MRKFAPVALFVYNRVDHTVKTLDYLKKNKFASETELFIYSDAAKTIEQEEKVLKVRESILDLEGFKSVKVIKAQKNKGLANSIIDGVSELIDKYGRVIVLEDDILTSPQFLQFMNDALDFYEKITDIWSISGYSFPINIPNTYKSSVYFGYRASSWGWATWKDRWDTIDWKISDFNSYKFNLLKIHHFCKGGNDLDKMLRYQMSGKIDSWAVRWCYNQAFQNKYTIYPLKSLVTNIGTDGSGTHCDSSSKRFNVDLYEKLDYEFEEKVTLDNQILHNFKNLLDRSITRKIKKVFYKIFKGEVNYENL